MTVKQIIGYLLQKYDFEDKLVTYDSYGIEQEIDWDNIDRLLQKEGSWDE